MRFLSLSVLPLISASSPFLSIDIDFYNLGVQCRQYEDFVFQVSEELESRVTKDFLNSVSAVLIDLWSNPSATLPSLSPAEQELLAFESYARASGVIEALHGFLSGKDSIHSSPLLTPKDIETLMRNVLSAAAHVESEMLKYCEVFADDFPQVVPPDTSSLLDQLFVI